MSKICIIGNSVAAPRTPQEAPLAGWGQFLADFLTPYHEVRNYARDAMTARTYFTDRFATLLNLLEPGDMVLMNLGLVEQRIDNPLRYHGPKEFKEFLHLYVDGIRAEGAFPVLVTPVVRCAFAVDGNVADTRGVYPELMREVAAETGASFVDLGAFTLQWLQELGRSAPVGSSVGSMPASIPITPRGSSTRPTSTRQGPGPWLAWWPWAFTNPVSSLPASSM